MPIRRRSFIIFILLLAMFTALSGCNRDSNAAPVSESRLLLDTVCTITIYDPAIQEPLIEAMELCSQYEFMFSRTKEGGDVWRINNAGGMPVEVDEQVVRLLREGLYYGDLSGGWFDITIGRLSALWDFNGAPAVPSQEALVAARNTVDYRQVFIDGDTVRLGDAEVMLDLGGIAKGYIADRLADFLKERGVESAIIDLGGNIVTVGLKPSSGRRSSGSGRRSNGGQLWNIGVTAPFQARSELIGSLSVEEASIVTSGIYERQFIENDTLYHHILDPFSGLPVDSDVMSVTIVSESSAVGDALSTIVLLLGSEGAVPMLEQAPGIMGAVLMLKSGELLQFGDINFIADGGER